MIRVAVVKFVLCIGLSRLLLCCAVLCAAKLYQFTVPHRLYSRAANVVDTDVLPACLPAYCLF